MNKKSIYDKYCNDIQNPALGASLIAIFCDEFHKQSIKDEYPQLHLIFIIIPLILNENFCNQLVNEKGNKRTRKTEEGKEVLSYLSKIVNNYKTANNLHHYTEVFRKYTLTCVAFAKKLNIIEVSNDAKIKCISDKISKLPKDNRYLKAAKLLGEYFANGVSLSLIQQKLGVIF